MPVQKFVDEANFANDYKNYLFYVSYMQQWTQAVADLSVKLQSSPIYSTALSLDEQSGIDSSAAIAKVQINQMLQITPVNGAIK
jgi:hypothetical protein